ncbi:MAG: hypothetical protein QOH41_2008 [Blastocatellia bacterium]|jgi:hypothetical protein|nr:hypothetical protein [Blastocatellia bacterium]
MDQLSSTDPEIQSAIEIAQLEKLNLEIRDLKRKSPWIETLLQLAPTVTVLVTGLGLFFAFYQFHKGQQVARATERTDQRVKLQTQIRNDLDQIVQFPADTNQTVARVSFLLQDLTKLEGINQSDLANAGEPDKFAAEQRSISDVFARMILKDIDYNKQRDVDFARVIFHSWDDYHNYLMDEKDQASLHYILIKTLDALYELHKRYPDYFSQVHLNEANLFTADVSEPNLAQVRYFESLLNSFPEYLELIKDASLKQQRVKQFQAALCNPTLTQQKFNLSFDLKDKEFGHCVQHK